jgi:RNA-directed DNA polymerase
MRNCPLTGELPEPLVQKTPAIKQRTALLQRLRRCSGPGAPSRLGRVIAVINPILRGWVNYF